MYELKDSAQYLVASQTFVPFAGWPYDRILPRVSGKDPESVGRIIVDEYVNFFNEPDREERVAMTLTNLDRVGSFADLLHELGVAIKDTTKAPQALPVMRDSFFANPAGTTRPVLDLLSLSGDLAEAAEDLRAAPESTKTLIAAAGRLKAIANEIRREFKGPNAESTDRLIVHSRAHPSLENFHGVGVFAPFVVDDGRLRRLIVHDGKRRRASSEPPRSDDGEEEFKRVREGWVKYNELAIFKRPTVNSAGKPAGDVVAASSHASKPCWPELVFGTLAREQPEETVDANGIVRRADRSAVNQMLFAVDASHRLLARATEAARTVAKQELIGRIDPKCAQRANKLLARLGPPDLRLTTLEAVLKRKPPTETQCIDTPEASPLIDALNKVERRLGQVERTVRRVVTDATLGIGPSRSPDGIGASLSQKSMDGGLKEKPIEQGLLEKSMDQGLFDVDKSLDPGFGSPTGALDQISLGSKIVFASSNSELGSLATVELLGKVTRGLLLLERDVASIERNIADFLANQERIVPALPGDRFAETLEDRLDELFDLLEQDRARAHMTIRWVLRHPTFGLGPGAPAIGRAEREAFATTAGFNPHQLRLLSGPKRRGMCGD